MSSASGEGLTVTEPSWTVAVWPSKGMSVFSFGKRNRRKASLMIACQFSPYFCMSSARAFCSSALNEMLAKTYGVTYHLVYVLHLVYVIHLLKSLLQNGYLRYYVLGHDLV